jgi:hypothetical protein
MLVEGGLKMLKTDIIQALQSERTLQDLYQLFPERSTSSVRGTVNKLVYDGLVERTGEGRYRLASTTTHEPARRTDTSTRKETSQDTKKASEEDDEVEAPGTGAGEDTAVGTPAKPEDETATAAGVNDTAARARAASNSGMKDVLISALERFAGTTVVEPRDDTSGAATVSTRPRGGLKFPDFDSLRQVLEPDGYTFKGDFFVSEGIKDMKVLINPSRTFGVVKLEGTVPGEDIYQLPENLVKSGRLARNSWVATESRKLPLPPFFDCLKAIGKRNNESLRARMRFFFDDTRGFVYFPGVPLLFVHVSHKKDNDTPTWDLVPA